MNRYPIGPNGRRLNSLAQRSEDEPGQTLEELHRYVADDRVANRHVGDVLHEIAPLDVTDEVQAAVLVEHLRRLPDRQVALALLLADREQGDAGF